MGFSPQKKLKGSLFFLFARLKKGKIPTKQKSGPPPPGHEKFPLGQWFYPKFSPPLKNCCPQPEGGPFLKVFLGFFKK